MRGLGHGPANVPLLLLYRSLVMWKADDRRFIFVTGKGGVGKTTVAAALARALAGRGKRVLIVMCNAKERVSAMFACDPVGSEIASVAERIWAVNVDPELAFQEYGRMVLKVPGLYRVVFQNKYVKSFLPAVPGLSDWAMLGKAWYHTTERTDGGRHRFDVVLFDAPATGHGLDMLRVPKVIVDVVPAGVLRRDAETAWRMFKNPEETGVVVVTLPEELPVTETLELVSAVRGELELPLGILAVNGVLPALFSEPERKTFRAIEIGASPVSTPEEAVVAAARRALQEELQAASLTRLLAGASMQHVVLPYLFEDAATPRAIEALSAHF